MTWPTDDLSNANTDQYTDKPSLARADINALILKVKAVLGQRAVAGGICDLDGDAKVPTTRLPTVPIANGGTGQTAQTAAFDALAPGTTKGDLIVFNGSDHVRLPIGTNGQAIIADSGQVAGVKWGDVAADGTFRSWQVFGGSATYYLPANCKRIRVFLIGGGGGGAGAGGNGAGGGGAAGWGWTILEAAAVGASRWVTIGGGGGGGGNSQNGGGGGTSDFGGLAWASGGGGGLVAARGGDPGTAGISGSGLASSGGYGHNGTAEETFGHSGGNGAPSFFGSGGRGSTNTGYTATSGACWGSGGGGSSMTGYNGGWGVSGLCIVEEYY